MGTPCTEVPKATGEDLKEATVRLREYRNERVDGMKVKGSMKKKRECLNRLYVKGLFLLRLIVLWK